MEGDISFEIQQYIITTWLTGDARGFDADTDLQHAGVLDSFSTLALIGFIDERFGIQLEPAEVSGETFRSVRTLARQVTEALARAATGGR
jgi:acyl carrier protein